MRKKLTVLIALPLVILLAACASLKLPGSTQSTSSQAASNQNATMNMANQPVENKLAMGILALEGTDKAVTAEQAKSLLPLWKAVKNLGTSSSASTNEVNGLYTQIQENMTAEQVQAIKDLNLSPEEMQTLFSKYGIQSPQGGPNGQNPGAMPTRSAQSSNRNSTGGNNAGAAGGGMMPLDGGVPGGGQILDGSAPGGFAGGGQPTPAAGQQARGGFRGGLNIMLADPVIKLLEERAAS